MTLQFGRRPPKNALALRLGHFLSGALPAHPPAVDYLAYLSNWAMLGNDSYGDCVAVTLANVRRLVTAELSQESYMTLDQVLAFYKTQNPAFPAEDNGMDIQTALETLVHDGGPDGTKAVAFAKVDYTNPDEVKAAIAIFGYVWTGINVQNANMDDFSAGRDWDYHPGDPIEGGHSVVVGGYIGDPANDERFITWATETGFTDAFWSNLVEEAWVVIWPEHFGTKAFEQGVDLAQLAADYQAITGSVLPSPVAPQPPAPNPAPGPVGCLPTLLVAGSLLTLLR